MENINETTQTPKAPKFKVTTLILVVLCACLTMATPTIAKFISENSGYADVQVAAFAADAGSASDNSILLDYSEGITSANYTFWVSNKENNKVSEVKNEYKVIIDLPKALPAGLQMLVDNKAGTISNGGKTYTYTDNAWTFDAGIQGTRNHILTFKADFDVVEDDFSTDGIEIRVKMSQVG